VHQPDIIADLDELTARAAALIRPGRRTVLGLTGSQGAGKTTLAVRLAERVNASLGAGTAVHLPMDGFHLANVTLDRLGRHDRKGALDTFDGWGFVALLRRARTEIDHEVYVPSFRRSVDEPIAAEITIPVGAALLVVEGNYLLVDTEPWRQVRTLLDEAWFCVTPAEDRLSRLVDRHTRHGRTVEAATAWATEVDQANAALIESTRTRADVLVSGSSR